MLILSFGKPFDVVMQETWQSHCTLQGISWKILFKKSGLLLAIFMVVQALFSMKGCENTCFFPIQTLVDLLKKCIRCFVHFKKTACKKNKGLDFGKSCQSTIV